MKTKVTNLLKSLLWRLIKRDFIILNPNLHTSVKINNFSIISNRGRSVENYLPVGYNYHIDTNWRINYYIRGEGNGRLTYLVSAPNEEAFCKFEINVKLPFDLKIERIGEELFGNGFKLEAVNNKTLPQHTFWLLGKFEFKSTDGNVYNRQTGHRLRLEASAESAEENYFKGDVYSNYEVDARFVPSQILNKLEGYVSKKGKFLDIGCATGMTVEYALSKGYDAEGIDYSDWAVKQANIRTNGRCKVLNLDAASSSDFTSKYDAISLHSVIEHLTYPEKALEILFEICNPNGVVYIETLNADSMMHRIMKDDWEGYSDYTHKSPWITADWLVETAIQKGFEVVSVRRHYLWNDNVYDDVWRTFTVVLGTSPLNTILEDGLGDLVELVIRKPAK